MKRFALALSAIVVGVVVSSCAVGVRQPATDITETSATLNGKVLSTTGGPGSWYIEYGPTAARTERTPTRTIDFVANESEPVSEPVDGLEPGRPTTSRSAPRTARTQATRSAAPTRPSRPTPTGEDS